jgi:hypothetical protein
MQAERIAIKRIVFIFEEGLRPAIAALRDLVGCPGNIALASLAIA